MPKLILRIGLVFLFFAPSFANAQDKSCNEAETFFNSLQGDCKSMISAHNCIHLDVTDSYDFQGKEFTFLWKMSDGSELEGMEINYCFKAPGQYTATLSLLDPITKTIIKDEAAIDIEIKGEFKLEIDLPKTVESNQNVAFKYSLNYPENTHTIMAAYWYFDDGTFSCLDTPSHYFQLPGQYIVRLIMILSSASGQEVLCSSDTIEVSLPDPSEGVIKNLFDSIPVSSRFLADNIYYKVITTTADSYSEITNFDSLSGSFTYQLLAYRGNLFLGSNKITTSEEYQSNDIQKDINKNAIELAKSVPQELESLFFELDQEDLSKKNKKILKENINLLTQFSMINISVGVYTNTKGSLEKGVEFSIKRATLIKNYLLENGIDSERIEIASPSNSRSLINSCVTGNNCSYSDPALNRRADFKILNRIN